METLILVFETIALITDVLSVGILCIAAVRFVVGYVVYEIRRLTGRADG